jgi:predicted acetyltransferase
MPNPVYDTIQSLHQQHHHAYLHEVMGLRDMATAEATQKQLRDTFKSTDGMMILYLFLRAAFDNYPVYQSLKISDDVFIETYKALPRFIKEFHKQSGQYAFERDWWAYRQTAMNIFRIGELEYEMTSQENTKVLSIHIPSDADLTHSHLETSFRLARLFFNRRYKDYEDVRFYCHTWLLSPALKGLLEPSSKILAFQSYFDITTTFLENNSYLYWVFQTRDTDLSKLETKTSLQKRIKTFVETGGHIGTASGYVNFDHFIYRFETPNRTHQASVMDYKREMLANQDRLNGTGGLGLFDDYDSWLKHLDDKLHLRIEGETIPTSEYLLLDKQNTLYAMVNIRHFLDDELRQSYGHAGASVNPKFRKQGYAKLALSMALEVIKSLGEDAAMISCSVYNLGSRKTIEACGGIFEHIVMDHEDVVEMRIYWIYI